MNHLLKAHIPAIFCIAKGFGLPMNGPWWQCPFLPAGYQPGYYQNQGSLFSASLKDPIGSFLQNRFLPGQDTNRLLPGIFQILQSCQWLKKDKYLDYFSWRGRRDGKNNCTYFFYYWMPA